MKTTRNARWLMTLLPLLAVSSEAATKPVALVGSAAGSHETKVIAKEILLASAAGDIPYENRGGELPMADLDKYGLLIVATAVKTPLDGAGFGKLESWVMAGGHLLLIQGAPTSMIGPAASPGLSFTWAGFDRSVYLRSPRECELLQPNHWVLKGAFDEASIRPGKKPEWMARASVFAVPKGNMESIIGCPSGCLVGFASVGKGWVAYLGHELYRLQSAKADSDRSWRRILQNLVDDAVSAKPAEAPRAPQPSPPPSKP